MPVIYPGASIGVLGGGQLGRMFSAVASRLGYRVHVYSPEVEAPAAVSSFRHHCGEFGDHEKLQAFSECVQLSTFEFENIPKSCLSFLSDKLLLAPHAGAIELCQHRLREKEFLESIGSSPTQFCAATSKEDLASAAKSLGFPFVVKTSAYGYDGKGQTKVTQESDLPGLWEEMGSRELICEQFVDLRSELSVVVARNSKAQAVTVGPFWNEHQDHILDVVSWEQAKTDEVSTRAVELALKIAAELDYVGVLCVELFLTRSGDLLVNELAPRPHNSGHLTIEAFEVSQFELQLRAICGLPLEMPKPRAKAAVMVNLLGKHLPDSEENYSGVLKQAGVYLHLYGKRERADKRKMGHITVLADTLEQAKERALSLRASLRSFSA